MEKQWDLEEKGGKGGYWEDWGREGCGQGILYELIN